MKHGGRGEPRIIIIQPSRHAPTTHCEGDVEIRHASLTQFNSSGREGPQIKKSANESKIPGI